MLSRSDLVINLSVVQMRLSFSFLVAQSVLCFLLLASYLDSVREVCRADFRLYQLLKRIGLIYVMPKLKFNDQSKIN